MKTIFVVLLLGSAASAAMQRLDAAEYDIQGISLTYEGQPMVAWRATIDNRQGLTDLVDVRFKMNWTGTANAMPSVWWGNPLSPWYGAPNIDLEFFIDGVLWYSGVVYYTATREIVPAFTPEGALPDPSTWGIIPAGCSWDATKAISGPDVKLFHSAASGDLTIDGVVTTLYDDDPLPQTIPDPSSLLLLSLLACRLLVRRRR